MKIRTKLKRLKAENEKLKSELEFYSARRTIPNLITTKLDIETLRVRTSVNNGCVSADYAEELAKRSLIRQIATEIISNNYVKVRSFTSELLPYETIYEADLKIVVDRAVNDND